MQCYVKNGITMQILSGTELNSLKYTKSGQIFVVFYEIFF